MVTRKTAGSRISRAIKTIAVWCRLNRHVPIGEQYRALWQKLRGHSTYYGITGNLRAVHRFRHAVLRVWRKWLSRRHRGGLWTWARFNALLRSLPPPVARAGPSPRAANP